MNYWFSGVTIIISGKAIETYGTPCDQPLLQIKAYTLQSSEHIATVTVEDMAVHQTAVTHTFTVTATFDSLKDVTNAFLQETGDKAWESVVKSYNKKLELTKEKAKAATYQSSQSPCREVLHA